jgi:SAM-dependent methyltransferase
MSFFRLQAIYRTVRLKMLRILKAALVALRDRIDALLALRSKTPIDNKLPDINHTLHDSRSARLRRLPPFSGTMLSAGCAGRWYFDWIAQRTGHSGPHIGIEFYNPMPADLPDNVKWIANTAGDMHAVADASCDIVFSGQNLEHMWPQDVVGFFLESHRVLKPSGLLVVDSPNRLITEPLVWSHPEHTVEFTPAEARQLAVLSGFEVTAVKGIWLCRHPETGRVLPLDPAIADPDFTYAERLLTAEADPDNSFIWWLEARKATQAKPAELKAEMDRIFAAAWPERQRRFLSIVGTRERSDDHEVIRCPAGTSGVMVYGPSMPLESGSYAATFVVHLTGAAKDAIVVRCDILGHNGREIAARDYTGEKIAAENGRVTLDFTLTDLEFGIQARCISRGRADVQCELPIAIIRSGPQ